LHHHHHDHSQIINTKTTYFEVLSYKQAPVKWWREVPYSGQTSPDLLRAFSLSIMIIMKVIIIIIIIIVIIIIIIIIMCTQQHH
jgi:hypothetical protein